MPQCTDSKLETLMNFGLDFGNKIYCVIIINPLVPPKKRYANYFVVETYNIFKFYKEILNISGSFHNRCLGEICNLKPVRANL